MSHKEYIIFCDESDASGRYFSDFYGGLIVGSGDIDAVTRRLNDKKRTLNLHGEVKWSKVTERYLDKYQDLIAAFFEEIAACILRVRIMFRNNDHQPHQHAPQEERYFKLYYQFIKHAFGLRHRPREARCQLRIHFDQLPHTKEGAAQFKGYVRALQNAPGIRAAGFRIRRDDITEYRSHDHVLAQCLDIVLGSVTFRLNKKYETDAPGKRTKAKEQLSETILAHIQRIRPGFDIAVSTGSKDNPPARWSAPYMHWSFVPVDKKKRPHTA